LKNKVVIVPSVYEDVLELKDNLRAEDINECQACGHTPQEALEIGFKQSGRCYSAKINGHIAAMFGVSTLSNQPTIGVIWYLGSDVTMKHPITMVKGGLKYTNQWFEKYNILMNIVDARNITHIAWLKRIGFKFLEQPVMCGGYKFYQFFKTKQDK